MKRTGRAGSRIEIVGIFNGNDAIVLPVKQQNRPRSDLADGLQRRNRMRRDGNPAPANGNSQRGDERAERAKEQATTPNDRALKGSKGSVGNNRSQTGVVCGGHQGYRTAHGVPINADAKPLHLRAGGKVVHRTDMPATSARFAKIEQKCVETSLPQMSSPVEHLHAIIEMAVTENNPTDRLAFGR